MSEERVRFATILHAGKEFGESGKHGGIAYWYGCLDHVYLSSYFLQLALLSGHFVDAGLKRLRTDMRQKSVYGCAGARARSWRADPGGLVGSPATGLTTPAAAATCLAKQCRCRVRENIFLGTVSCFLLVEREQVNCVVKERTEMSINLH